jgi:hypothetical protein
MMNTVASILASDSAATTAGRSGIATGVITSVSHYLGWLQSMDIAWWGAAFSILGVGWMMFNGFIRLVWDYQDRKNKRYQQGGDMENAE